MTDRKRNNIIISLLIVILCILMVIILLGKLNSVKEENKSILTFITGAVISFGVNAGYFLINEILLIKDEENKNQETKELTDKLRCIHIDESSVVRFKFIEASDFYDYLDYARKNAKKRVYLTNFSIIPYEIETKNSYFRKELSYCRSLYKQNHEAKIKRIITIHTKDKLQLYKKIIKKMVDNDIKNFNLAYLHIDNFDETAYLPGVIGIQIIDDDVIIMDPRIARIGQDEPPILIQNPQIAAVFKEYHKKLWKEIEGSNGPEERGCILYCGDYGKEKNKSIFNASNIWTTIENQMVQENQSADNEG